MVRFKRINISRLMQWRNTVFSHQDFRRFPRSRDVRKGQDQFWQHVPGKEYLTGNPLYAPGLQAILLDAARNEDEEWKINYTPLQVDPDVFPTLS